MKLTEMLPVEDWMILEKDINERFGLNASVFDEDGIRITGVMKWANSLCPVVKASKRGQSYICAAAHQNIAGQAKQTRKPVVGECDAGLVKIAVPIFLNDQFLGVAGGCGKIINGSEVESFLINKITGMSEARIEALSKDIHRMEASSPHDIVQYVQQRIDKMVKDYQKQLPKTRFQVNKKNDPASDSKEV